MGGLPVSSISSMELRRFVNLGELVFQTLFRNIDRMAAVASLWNEAAYSFVELRDKFLTIKCHVATAVAIRAKRHGV